KDAKNFDFQIKFIETSTMTARGRAKQLEDGTTIYGTMHEKFGVFYRKDSPIPFDCFAGSANASTGADQLYAESRMYFYNRPAVARQFQEEFARLWNEFGTAIEGNCVSEKLILVDPVPGDVQVIFNSEPISEEADYSIDEALKKLIQQVSSQGSLDLAMFSFTHYELARTMMDCARKNPKAKFRIMMDQTMLANTDSRQGVMGPWLDEQIKRQKLKNVEVRYKWRSNAYGWDEEKKQIDILHSENLLLHHKLMIINRSIMANGSFNWSDSAEERNFENLMIFRRPYPDHGAVLDQYLDEFDTLWNTLKEEGLVKNPLPKQPQMIHFDRAVALSQKIIQLMTDEKNREILAFFKQEPFLTIEDMFLFIPLSEKELKERLDAMVEATILCYYKNEQQEEGYSKAD
ncbi:MAG: phospholipase D-like domain-containing protein, partial [Planctomycetota bacterium]